MAQSTNNYVYVGDVPVFYWPTLATDLENPSYYINSARFRHDSIFGFQALIDARRLPDLPASRRPKASNGTSTSIT